MSVQQPAGTNEPIDVARGGGRLAIVAFWLAVLAVPGVFFTWDLLPMGGFLTGVPLAIVAVVLGLRARRRTDGRRSAAATAAVVLGAACLVFVAVWSGVELATGTFGEE